MRQTEFYIAIIGAISKFKGFGDIIASSQIFLKDMKQVRAVSEIDKEVASFYDNYPSSYLDLFQWFGFPKKIAETNCFLIIRAKKKFTAFPEQNRFYDRREYFYLTLDNDIDSIDFSASIPEMVQYETEQLGQVNNFLIKEANYPSDEKFNKYIITSLLTQSTVIVKVTENNADETKDKILGSIQKWPDVYKKYLGFGFNLESNAPFVKNYLHLLTTLDDNGVEANTLPPLKINDIDLNDFAEALLNMQIQYDASELELLNTPINRDTLFELVKYHKLHFRIDKYLNSSLEESKKQDLFSESQNYISTFLTSAFASNQYLQKRIFCIYKFWHNGGLLKTETFLWFWKKFGEAKLKHEKFLNDYEVRESVNTFIQIEFRSVKSLRDADNKYFSLSEFPSFNYPNVSLLEEIKIEFYKQKKTDTTLSFLEINELDNYINPIEKKAKLDIRENLLRNVDFKKQSGSISSEEGFELLKEKIEQLSSSQIEEIISYIGLTTLFQILKTGFQQKLLRNNNFNVPVLELAIKQDNFNEILKWVSLLQNNNVKPNFNTGHYLDIQSTKINSHNDFSLFDSLCKSIINNISLFKNDEVSAFIKKILEKTGCQQGQFFSSAFSVAEKFNFKINVSNLLPNDDKQSIDFISLLEKNIKLIENSEILENLKQIFFDLFSQKADRFDKVLSFPDENLAFVSANAIQFSDLLNNIFLQAENDSLKYQNTLALFNNIIEKERNLFLNPNSNLYNSISELANADSKFINELYDLGLKIEEKNKDEFSDAIKLIDKIIDNNFPTQNSNFLINMKNKVYFIRYSTKLLLFGLLFTVVFTLSLAFYYCFQNNNLSLKLEKVSQENSNLTYDIQNLEYRLSNGSKNENSYNLTNEFPLTPTPNGELNLNDINVTNKRLIYGMHVDSVVSIIYSINPTDISSHYKSQIKAYASELIKTNVNSFNNGIFTGAPLQHIPSFK